MANFESDNYYENLGITQEVDEKGIKKAYRKLAVMWHPVSENNPSDQFNIG